MKTLKQKRDELSLLELGDHCWPFDRGFDAGVAACDEMMRELVEALKEVRRHRANMTGECCDCTREPAIDAIAAYEKWKSES